MKSNDLNKSGETKDVSLYYDSYISTYFITL
jgi:hypothetical protein